VLPQKESGLLRLSEKSMLKHAKCLVAKMATRARLLASVSRQFITKL